MLSAVLLLILWSWGLTPLWVNTLCTALLVVRFGINITVAIIKAIGEKIEEKTNKQIADRNDLVNKFLNK